MLRDLFKSHFNIFLSSRTLVSLAVAQVQSYTEHVGDKNPKYLHPLVEAEVTFYTKHPSDWFPKDLHPLAVAQANSNAVHACEQVPKSFYVLPVPKVKSYVMAIRFQSVTHLFLIICFPKVLSHTTSRFECSRYPTHS